MTRLIDADWLLNAIEKLKVRNTSNTATIFDVLVVLNDVEKIIKAAPINDPVKHGHWIYVGAHNGVHLFECSLCHCGLNTENPDWLSKYCSGCGAKMEVNTND